MNDLIAAHNTYTRLMEKRARAAFLNAVFAASKRSDLALAVDEIRSGKVAFVQGDIITRLRNFTLNLSALEVVIRDCYTGGARVTAKVYGNRLSKANEPRITHDFTPGLPDAVEWARDNAATMVTNINVATREAIKQRVQQAMYDGEAPWELAESLRDVVGLTPQMVRAVETYRATQMQMMSRTAANRLTKQYANSLLNVRATTIARTEVLKACNAGQNEYWKQGIQEGVIDPGAMVRQWIATIPSERTCSTCGNLDGETSPIDGTFSGGYDMPPAHPQCRCTTGLVFADDVQKSAISKSSTEQESKKVTRMDNRVLELIAKYNHNHDRLGRFAAGSGRASAESASADSAPHEVLAAAGIKNIGGRKDIDEYGSAAEARADAAEWTDYTAFSVMTGDGTIRHFAARLTPAGKKVIAAQATHGNSASGNAIQRPRRSNPKPEDSRTAQKPKVAAAKKPLGPKLPIAYDDTKPVRPGFRRVTDTHDRASLPGTHSLKGAIPPAWTDVQVSINPKGVKQARGGALVATGKDAKGRTQYLYSAEHSEAAGASKFKRIRDLQAKVPKLDARLAMDSVSNPVAGSLLLMRKLGMRPGSDRNTGAEKKAYGATNLEVRHAKLSRNGKSVTFDFDSKKGGHTTITSSDPRVVETVKAHRAGKKPTDRLFTGVDEAKSDAYIKSVLPGFKQKDLRTLHGTALAHEIVSGMPKPKNATEAKRMKKAVATEVSQHLGNTPTVALNSYIAPEVFGSWGY